MQDHTKKGMAGNAAPAGGQLDRSMLRSPPFEDYYQQQVGAPLDAEQPLCTRHHARDRCGL